MKWPWKKETPKPMVAELPGQEPTGEGRLDPYSDTWVFIRSRCEQRLAELRESNDNPNLGFDQTAMIRGRIAQIKEVLALPEPEVSAPAYENDGMEDAF